MNTAYREVFPKAFPARATVEAGLVAPDGLVEIMMTAVKKRQRGCIRAATRLPQGVGQ